MLAHVGLTPASRLAGDWHAPIGVLLGATVVTFLFAQAFVRLRRRGRADLAPWTRPLLFGAGMTLAVLPLVSPLDAVGDGYLLSAHMLQHVLIGDVAPVLLVLAVRGPLVFFLLPPALLGPLARFHPLRALLAFVLRPLVSFSLWAAAMLVWHLPSAYDGAIRHPLVHDAEHLSFVLAGTLAWTQLLDPARRERLTLMTRPAIEFETDPLLGLGEFGIQTGEVEQYNDVRAPSCGEPIVRFISDRAGHGTRRQMSDAITPGCSA